MGQWGQPRSAWLCPHNSCPSLGQGCSVDTAGLPPLTVDFQPIEHLPSSLPNMEAGVCPHSLTPGEEPSLLSPSLTCFSPSGSS